MLIAEILDSKLDCRGLVSRTCNDLQWVHVCGAVTGGQTGYEMFIIDGHNLLHSIDKAEEGPESISDFQLCRIVGRFLKLIG